MSTNRISLKHPAVIGVVALAMVAVAALNIATFSSSGGKRDTSRGYRLQAHPPVPVDARPAIWNEAVVTARLDRVTAEEVEGMERDPFYPAKKQPASVRPAHRKSGGKGAPRRAAAKPPVCSAVMLMGETPMAVIDGKGYEPGDSFGSLKVQHITAEGVTLVDGQGKARRLAVGPETAHEEPYRVVTRPRGVDEQGRTRLNDK